MRVAVVMANAGLIELALTPVCRAVERGVCGEGGRQAATRYAAPMVRSALIMAGYRMVSRQR